MKTIKDLLSYSFNSIFLGLLSIFLTEYLKNSNYTLKEFFISNTYVYLLKVILIFLFLGIIHYFADGLYNKINWKKASILNYLLVVGSILIVFVYLKYIVNVKTFVMCIVVVSLLFFMNWFSKYIKVVKK